MNKILLPALLVSLFMGAKAQSPLQFGAMPSVNINKKFQKDWTGNFKAESRLILYNEEFDYKYSLTDLSLIASKRISPSASLGFGYLARIEDNTVKNRAIQQLSLVRRYTGWRLAHRIMADQTFEKDEDTEFRFRYRISAEFPLEGQTLDVGEFFLKANNEYLNSFQGGEYDLEIRTTLLLGYSISARNSLEAGADYRVDSFISNNTRNRLWFSINFFQSIGK